MVAALIMVGAIGLWGSDVKRRMTSFRDWPYPLILSSAFTRVSKDEASWFETAHSRLLTMRISVFALRSDHRIPRRRHHPVTVAILFQMGETGERVVEGLHR
jgi:hypothetical protein